MGGAFPMADGVDSRFRGNDCSWELQYVEFDTTGFQVFTRSSKYDPASPKRTSGDHAATTGGNWLRFPMASNMLEIDQ